MSTQMFFESKSNSGFDDTVEKLTEYIAEGGWRLQHVHNLQQTMTNNGFSVLPAKVFELCFPEYAYKLLSADELRIYSNMMPCRIAVYDKEDGNTYVSRMNTAMLAGQIGGTVEEVMKRAFNDAEVFIKKLSE